VRARYLKPCRNSYEVRLLELRLVADLAVQGAFRVEELEDCGLAPRSSTDPWIHSGLFDSHLHVTWTGETRRRVVAGAFADVESYIEALRQRLCDTPADEILISYGFDEDRWGLRRDDLFARVGARLDPTRKWLLYRVCGHLACASPALLEGMKMASEKRLLDDTEIQRLHARMPAPSRAQLKFDFLEAQRCLLEAGIDTVGDMSLDAALLPAVLELHAENLLQLDYQGVMLDDPQNGAILDAPIYSHNGPRHFEVCHWKRYLDGSFGARTAWLRRPYTDDPTTQGLRLYETQELIAAARGALEKGFALSFHAIGDAALEQLLELSDVLKDEMAALNARAGRPVHRIEHAQLMGDDQLLRLKKLGLWILCVQPHHREADAAFIVQRLGPERTAREAYRLASLVEAALPVSLGSDAPITFFEAGLTLAASNEIPFEDALWRFSEGGRVIHGFCARHISVGSRVWLLEPRAISTSVKAPALPALP